MKILVTISRIVVGLLFIISGLIKLNDPVGFSFKLEEYFSPDVLNIPSLFPYALVIAIFVVIFEVLLGVMILLGYAKRFTVWCLLLMIVFFTFLTFYSAYFNKVTDCGCFGDAIKLTPWESFIKDVILLVLILLLFFGRKYITPLFTSNIRSISVFASLVGCLLLAWHVLEHLPIIDFRAYKIGNNITEGMTVPPNAQQPVYEYAWKYSVNGKEEIIINNGQAPTIQGELITVETKQIEAGYIPPIHDFSMEREGDDYSEDFLKDEHLIVVIAYDIDKSVKDGFRNIREITNEALKKGYKVIGLSSSSQETSDALAEAYKLNFNFYFCDATTLKTIIRSNPGIIELQKGTIKQKLHYNDALKLELSELPNANKKLDVELKQRLDSIAVLDQKYRLLLNPKSPEELQKILKEKNITEAEYKTELWKLQNLVDSVNMAFVENYFIEKGYPGKSIVGEPTNTAAWFVLQHNPEKIQTYLPLIKEAGKAGEIPFTLVAMMEDRYLMNLGEEQIYGTQGSTDAKGNNYIWPIKNPETVNKRRAEAGFDETIEEYAQHLLGTSAYKVVTLAQANG